MKLTIDDYREAVKRLRLKSKSNYSNSISAQFCCPYHEDKTPSMGINFSTRAFNCFGCHMHGHINQLVIDLTGKTINEFLNLYDDIDIFNVQEEKEKEYKHITVLPLDIRGTFIPYYNYDRAKNYIHGRGITDDVAMKAQLQYCTEAYVNGTHFTDRVIIPMFNSQKQYINIEGRAIEKDQLKCLYPKNGSKPLYEYYKLDKVKPLYLFEGIIKMLVARTDLYFANSSATLGSNISQYQLKQLNEFKEVILIRDMDVAGKNMAKKLKEVYGGNLTVMMLTNSNIKDIDEVPTQLGMTVEEYRLKNGFDVDIEFI